MLKLCLVLLVVVALLMPHHADAWRWGRRRRSWRGRRFFRSAIDAYRLYRTVAGRRDVASDVNSEEVVDTSELASMLGERATAEDIADLVRLADQDGDGSMTRRELATFMNDLE